MKQFLLLTVIFLTYVSCAKSQGKISGTFFGDYYYKAGSDTIFIGDGEYSRLEKDRNGFEIRRLYLQYDHKFSKKFSGEFLIAYDGSSFLIDSARSVYIKKANLRWSNIFKHNDIIIGQMSTPTFSGVTEKLWGYRLVEKTIIDFHRLGISNDIGIELSGKIDSVGTLGYNLMIGNGRGQRLENNKYKKFYGELYSWLLNNRIILEGYADFEQVTSSRSRRTLKGLAGYISSKFRAGIEYFTQVQKNFNNDISDIKPQGISLFAAVNAVKDKLNFFGRLDLYDSDKQNTSTGYKEMYITAGLDFTPDKNVHIIPNIWINSYVAKGITITRKPDIVPRITFSCSYP